MSKLPRNQGPWTVSQGKGNGYCVMSKDHWAIADVVRNAFMPSKEPDTTAGNAHLIAAAPALYDALKAMMERTTISGSLYALELAHHAIAQADGLTDTMDKDER